MSFQSTVNCPDCGSPIVIESSLLLAGQSFSCSNPYCGVAISLSPNEIGKVSEAIQGFEEIRNQAKESAADYQQS